MPDILRSTPTNASKFDAIDAASHYAARVEANYAASLYQEWNLAFQKSQGCGCSSCMRHFSRIETELETEACRLTGFTEKHDFDHEEEWILNQAGNEHFNNLQDAEQE